MTDALHPAPELLEKLAAIVHTALHQAPGSPLDHLCRDPEVIAWAKSMDAIGLMPPPKVNR